jgi:hypothetical protein
VNEPLIIVLKLSKINQVKYRRIFGQTHKQYSSLQSLFNHKLLTKVIENAKQESVGLGDLESYNLRSGAKRSVSERRIAN